MNVAPSAPARVSQGWLLLAVLSLGLSSVAALVLVLARTPVLTALVAPDAFPRALVIHVNLATLLWYFAMAGALWTETLRPRHTRHAAWLLALSCAGTALVVLSGVAGLGKPVLANYVPYLDSPYFLLGLTLVTVSTLVTGALTVRPPKDVAEWGFLIARWPFAMALLYLALATQRGFGLVESLWGVGHILQFGFVTLLMSIWLRLMQAGAGRGPSPRVALALLVATALPATAAPLTLATGILPDGAMHQLQTELMRWTNWPAALILGLMLLGEGRAAWRAPSLVGSITLFVVGIAAGTAIDRETTMVPAHYHGTIGAFTLAQMTAVMARFGSANATLTELHRRRRPLRLYLTGSLLLIAGLAWSGWQGAPRKIGFSGSEADLSATLAAGLVGIGGAITIAGVALFALVALPRILDLCTPTRSRRRRVLQDNGAMFAAAP